LATIGLKSGSYFSPAPKDPSGNKFRYSKPTESRLDKEGRELEVVDVLKTYLLIEVSDGAQERERLFPAVDVLRTYLLIDVSDGAQERERDCFRLLMSFGHTY